jgi:hypothetical protein
LPHLRIAIQHTEAKFAAREYDRRFRSLEEFTRAKMELLEALVGEGYRLLKPSRRTEFCAATNRYTTMLDMNGQMYRCGTEPPNKTGHLVAGRPHLTNAAYEHSFTQRRYALAEWA